MQQKWGKYILEHLLAKGGMAEIFMASASSSDIDVPICIKRIRSEFSNDPEFESMFRQEARIAQSVNHPNVVKVFDFDRFDNCLFIVMEYVDGMDLKKVQRLTLDAGSAVPVGFAFYVLKSLLMALDAASLVEVDGEPSPVVHRDISPHNLLVSKSGDVKLTDFGIAKARGASTVTRTGVIKGKLSYLSPEQASGGVVGPVSDVFGAGLVLYELLTGSKFNKGSSEPEIIARVLNPPVPHIGWLSSEINNFLTRLMSKNIEDRFESAKSALLNLEQLDFSVYSKEEAALFVSALIKIDNNNQADFAFNSIPDNIEGAPTRPSEGYDQKKIFSVNKKMLGAVFATVLSVTLFIILFLFRDSQEQVDSDPFVSTQHNSIKEPVVTKEIKPEDSFQKERKGSVGLSDSLVVMLKDSDAGQRSNKYEHDKMVALEKSNVSKPHKGSEKSSNDNKSKSSDKKIEVKKSLAESKKSLAESKKSSHNMPVIADSDHSSASVRGSIQVNCRPWAFVYVDGKKIGTTPVKAHKLQPGKHVVKLINDALNYKKRIPINVKPSRLIKISEVISR